jgi:hypothetical protein
VLSPDELVIDHAPAVPADAHDLRGGAPAVHEHRDRLDDHDVEALVVELEALDVGLADLDAIADTVARDRVSGSGAVGVLDVYGHHLTPVALGDLRGGRADPAAGVEHPVMRLDAGHLEELPGRPSAAGVNHRLAQLGHQLVGVERVDLGRRQASPRDLELLRDRSWSVGGRGHAALAPLVVFLPECWSMFHSGQPCSSRRACRPDRLSARTASCAYAQNGPRQ